MKPFGRLNLRSFSASTCTWIKRLVLFSLQRTNPRSFHKISDKKLVKPIVENSWTFWSQLFIFPQRNQLSGCETHRSPILSTYIPPLWHKITGLVCVSQVHLYKAPKEMLGDRPFLNIHQRGKPLGEMAHDRVCEGIRHRCVWNLPRFIKKLEKKTEVVAGSSYLVPLIRWYGIYIYSWLVFMVNVGK